MAKAEPPRPTSVKISYAECKIVWLTQEEWAKEQADSMNEAALWESDECLISIRLAGNEDNYRECLLHEILHACWSFSMIGMENPRTWPDIEETTIRFTSPLLLDTLRRNPEVARYLLA